MRQGPDDDRDTSHDTESTRPPKRSPRRRTPPAQPASPATTPARSTRRGARPTPSAQPPAPAGATPRRTRRPTAAAEPRPPLLPEEVVDEAAPIAPVTALPAPEAEATESATEEQDATITVKGAAPPEEGVPPGATGPARRGRGAPRATHSNALGLLIEDAFADPNSPVRSYSELERHSSISREALSRYVTPRADRRRSPTIETLATIAEAMHLSLEQVCRAAAASARGELLPSGATQRVRNEVVAPLLAALTDAQFAAVVELLRQLHPHEA